MKNKSYIGIAFIVLLFGIYAVPKIVNKIKNKEVVEEDRLNIDGSPSKSNLATLGDAPNFSLLNQEGIKISNKDYKGKVYVLEFFFTTCPSICPIMNQNMKRIQDKFGSNDNFGIVSITINPEHDTPKVLQEHAKLIKAEGARWNFLTGDKNTILDIANKGFNLYAGENDKIPGGFEHSGLFALIDKNGKIRCRKDEFGNKIIYYDGLEKEGIKAIIDDITKLLKE